MKESLEFISGSNTDLPREEYTDIEIDLNSSRWISHRKQFLNIYKMKEKNELFRLTNVKKFIDILLEARLANTFGFDKDIKPEGTFIVDGERSYLEQNVFLRFLDSYIFRCGMSFNENCYQSQFEKLEEEIREPGKQMRILVLKNFDLKGPRELDLIGYKLRMLNELEIGMLLQMGRYGNYPRSFRFAIKEGESGNLDQLFCIEIPQAKFGERFNEETDSDMISLKILGLLRMFKDGPVSVSDEVSYRKNVVTPATRGFGIISNLIETTIPRNNWYTLDSIEISDLKQLEKKYSVFWKYFKSSGIALDRYLGLDKRAKMEDRIIDLYIALEALLGREKAEITYRLSLRASYYVTDDQDRRNEIFDVVYHGYNIRSKMVHGDFLDQKKDFSKLRIYKIDNLYSLTEKLSSIVFELMRKIVDDIYSSSYETSSFGKWKEELLNHIDAKILSGK